MKKLFMLICILSAQYAFANSKIPDAPLYNMYTVQYYDENAGKINADNMKNKDKIEEAKSKASKKSKANFYFDEKQFVEQKVLDYMDHKNNSFVPSF